MWIYFEFLCICELLNLVGFVKLGYAEYKAYQTRKV